MDLPILVKIGSIVVAFALLSYTVGVFASLFQKGLKKWHMVVFWIGFCFDTAATIFMSVASGGYKFNDHGITGLVALVCMLINAIGATIVLRKNNPETIKKYPYFSLIIWLIWLSSIVTAVQYFKK